ncbi:MAG: 50S ribosomal protein L22 [Clostridia bacterium]|nr:50S ribosomal protein L22 [Clostridia bacterium]
MAKRMREKALARKQNADRRPQATAKFIRISPSKVRIVLDIIRGKSYNEAMAILMSTPKAASEVLVKVLKSAGANAEFKNMLKDDLFVAEAFANEGPTYKRWWPRSHGSADQINKRTSHITIILDEKNSVLETIKAETKKVEEKKVEVSDAEVSEATAKPATPKKTTTKTATTKKSSTTKKTTTTKGGA